MTATTHLRESSGADEAALALAPPSRDVAVGDLDDLFCAVKDRLRNLVGADFEIARQARGDVAVTALRAGVLDCVAALDQLHETLAHEIARREQLEQVVQAAQLALARAHTAHAARLPARQPSSRATRLVQASGFVS